MDSVVAAFLDQYGGSAYRLEPFSAVDLCTICAAVAKLNQPPRQLFNQVARKLLNEGFVPELSLMDTSMLLWALATLKTAPKDLMYSLCWEAEKRLQEVQLQGASA